MQLMPSSDPRRGPRPPSGQAGVTIIEVLMAILVLSFGMLGIAGLQTSALSNTNLSNQYTIANNLAQDMADRMRANRQGVLDGKYAMTHGTAPTAPGVACYTSTASTTPCTADQMAAWDIAYWYAQLNPPTSAIANLPTVPTAPPLPGAQAQIACSDVTCTSTSIWIVTLYWNANRSTGTPNYSCNPATSTALRCVQIPVTP